MRTLACLLLIMLGAVAECDGNIWGSAARSATHCFAGTVTDVTPLPGRPQCVSATVLVREIWKGAPADTVTLVTENDHCGAWLLPGDDDVFLARVPDRIDLDRLGRSGSAARDSGRARLLYVTDGAYESYGATYGPDRRERWGVPIRVAGGQASREPLLDEVVDVLDGERFGDPEHAAKLLAFSTDYLRTLASSPEFADRKRFDRALAVLTSAMTDAYGHPGGTYEYLLQTLYQLKTSACTAVPVMLAFQQEIGADKLGVPYFAAILDADGYDPQVLRRKAEVLAVSTSPEMREFILRRTWSGPYDRPHENPQPAEYIRDPAMVVRAAAIGALTGRTTDRDSLVALARLALDDPEAYVAEQCLPYLIYKLDDERALGIALAGLEHPDERVALYVFVAATSEKRGGDLRCGVLRAALESKHPYIRMEALEYRVRGGAGCG